jgi:hypothetical protein
VSTILSLYVFVNETFFLFTDFILEHTIQQIYGTERKKERKKQTNKQTKMTEREERKRKKE